MGSNSRNAAAETDFQIPLILEVVQGRTQFRDRPVTTRRFVIGSGPVCDLRLGGEIPAVHSIIVCDSDGITLEAIAPAPALIHNGHPIISVQLQDGDLIRIGSLEFRAHVTGRLPKAAAPMNAAVSVNVNAEEIQDTQAQNLSAAELVERMAQEDAEIDDFERRRSQGAAALLQAAASIRNRPTRRDRIDTPHSGSNAPHFHVGIPAVAASKSAAPSGEGTESAQLINELAEIGQALQLLSQEIQTRSQRSTERELTLAQTISQLLETQQRLVTQLEQVTRQVHALQGRAAASSPKPRAIA